MKTFIVILLFLSPRVHAIECKALPWTWGRNVSIREISRLLNQMPREEIIQTAWSEMLNSSPKTTMSAPLLHYLNSTEQEAALRGYFKVLAISVAQSPDLRPVIKKWPSRVSLKKTTLTLSQMCTLYSDAKLQSKK